MGYNKAATYYFDLVLEKYHDTEYAERAMYYKAESLYRRKRYEDAESVIERFLERYPESEQRSDIEQLQESVRNEISQSATS